MKVHLLYRDRDLEPRIDLPSNREAMIQDLELQTLLDAMAGDDRFLLEVARKVLLSGLQSPASITYRQDVLKDCLANPEVTREVYEIATASYTNKRKSWLGIFTHYPSGILSSSVNLLQMQVGLLQQLREVADQHAGRFRSEGWTTFFAMIREELSDDYFACIRQHLKELRFRDGVLLSVALGRGNEGTGYLLRKPPEQHRSFIQRLFAGREPAYGFSVHPRDDHGARALSELKDRGINLIANALAQSADHIDSFFNNLRLELAFHVACLNLRARLHRIGAPIAFPLPVAAEERQHRFTGLYDVSLALTMDHKVVGNDVDADGSRLVIITGANQGGKSTFLRSIGLAQLMMQCGMFVPAEAAFCANICTGLFTHYRREEDALMESGKLDEELARMSEIVDQLGPGALVLFNESFAATNEREGSEIARQIVSALQARGVKVFYVTHLYEFAESCYEMGVGDITFLRAEREADGTRTFKLIESGPLQTSYGLDLYHRIFEVQPQTDGRRT